MSETRSDLREALARDLRTAAASIESSRTGLGVNGSLVSALGRLTFQNLPLILDALAQVSALQVEVERLQKVEGERGRLGRDPSGPGYSSSAPSPHAVSASGEYPSRNPWCFNMHAAPRDGSEFIAGCSRIMDGFQQVVYWDEDAKVPGWGVKDSDAIYPAGFFDCWQPLRPAPCDRSGEAGETEGLDPQGESTVTGVARQAPSNPLTETKEGSEHV